MQWQGRPQSTNVINRLDWQPRKTQAKIGEEAMRRELKAATRDKMWASQGGIERWDTKANKWISAENHYKAKTNKARSNLRSKSLKEWN
jgi:hypothetical protein